MVEQWWRAGTRRCGILVVAALAALILAPTATFAVSGLVGCDTSRSAVAYHADGTIVNALHTVPCAVITTYAGAETLIKVAPNGTLLEEPAFIHPLTGTAPDGTPTFDAFVNYAGFAVSTYDDSGGTWQRPVPEGTQGFGTLDNSLYIDRMTGRAFASSNEVILAFSPLVATGARLMTSTPPYTSWSHFPHPYISENPRFTSAPAPVGQPAASAGENPAYWCGNVFILGSGGRVCYRSLDGGATWIFRSQLVGGPPHSECGADPGSVIPSNAGEYPEGDNSSGVHRGSLWVLISCDAAQRLPVPLPPCCPARIISPVATTKQRPGLSSTRLTAHR